MRRKLRAVRRRIRSYIYLRNGKRIKVPEHRRTYYLAAAGLAGSYGIEKTIKASSKKRLIPVSDMEKIGKEIGIKSSVSLFYGDKSAYGLKGKDTPVIVIEKQDDEGLVASSSAAHELGHIYMLEKVMKKAPRIARRWGTIKEWLWKGGYVVPLVVRDTRKRKVILAAIHAPEIAEEAYASYLGYKGLKKTYGKVRPSEAIALAGSPLQRVALVATKQGIGSIVHNRKKNVV